jgi:hypothetical protein
MRLQLFRAAYAPCGGCQLHLTVHTHVCIAHQHAHLCVYCTPTCTPMCVLHTNLHAHARTRTGPLTLARTLGHAHSYTRAHTHTRTHTHTHAHTHTHTHTAAHTHAHDKHKTGISHARMHTDAGAPVKRRESTLTRRDVSAASAVLSSGYERRRGR